MLSLRLALLVCTGCAADLNSGGVDPADDAAPPDQARAPLRLVGAPCPALQEPYASRAALGQVVTFFTADGVVRLPSFGRRRSTQVHSDTVVAERPAVPVCQRPERRQLTLRLLQALDAGAHGHRGGRAPWRACLPAPRAEATHPPSAAGVAPAALGEQAAAADLAGAGPVLGGDLPGAGAPHAPLLASMGPALASTGQPAPHVQACC